jgi:hypothetical protein
VGRGGRVPAEQASIIYRLDPINLLAHEVLRTPDHIGGLPHDV